MCVHLVIHIIFVYSFYFSHPIIEILVDCIVYSSSIVSHECRVGLWDIFPSGFASSPMAPVAHTTVLERFVYIHVPVHTKHM